MAEYNFWDDRTFETNGDNYCPIIDYYCLSQDCENCADYKAYNEFYSLD